MAESPLCDHVSSHSRKTWRAAEGLLLASPWIPEAIAPHALPVGICEAEEYFPDFLSHTNRLTAQLVVHRCHVLLTCSLVVWLLLSSIIQGKAVAAYSEYEGFLLLVRVSEP